MFLVNDFTFILQEGVWKWVKNEQTVNEEFLWKTGEPNGGINDNCGHLSIVDFLMIDGRCINTSSYYKPLCQKF